MKSSLKLAIRTLFFFHLAAVSFTASSSEYWVSKSGSDANGCSNETTDACLTIQKGVSLLAAGDILNVKAGTYSDDGGRSAYKPNNTDCAWLDGDPASSSVCINSNGTSANPIIIQAAPGDEGNVIIDSQGSRIGVHLQNSDYVQIRGFKIINSRTICIASWGQPENSVADESKLSIGVLIDSNKIVGVSGPNGKNVSAVGMWGSKDWVVKNNRLDNVTVAGGHNASGIQAYGTINALVEHNYITNALNGVYWKDHFLKDAIGRGVPVYESEIKYNIFENVERGVYIAGAYEQAGINDFHHNIFKNYTEAGVYVVHQYNSLPGQAKGLNIVNNLFDGGSGTATATGILNDVYLDTRIIGNVFMRNKSPITFILYDVGEAPQLVESNYNVFDVTFGFVSMDHYSKVNSNRKYYSLGEWQGAHIGDTYSLAVDSPDSNSVVRSFAEIQSGTNINILPDGSRAGPYQNGNEVIGLLPGWPTEAILKPEVPNNILIR